jgi:hypothetical protein
MHHKTEYYIICATETYGLVIIWHLEAENFVIHCSRKLTFFPANSALHTPVCHANIPIRAPTAVQAAACCKRASTQYDPYDGHRTYVSCLTPHHEVQLLLIPPARPSPPKNIQASRVAQDSSVYHCRPCRLVLRRRRRAPGPAPPPKITWVSPHVACRRAPLTGYAHHRATQKDVWHDTG